MFRRNFILRFSALTLSTSLFIACKQLNGEALAQKKTDWLEIAESYKSVRKQKILNFNTGSATVLPDFIYDALLTIQKRYAFEAPYEVWEESRPNYERIKNELAQNLNVSRNEIALLRNCTEALNNILFGIPLNSEDTVLISKNEYSFVINAIQQRKKRHNFNLNIIDFELNESNQQIIQRYRKAIEKGCTYVILSYIDYHSGRILPVKEITKIAKKNNTKVIIDAAHAIGMIPQDLKSLDVDYYAASLHKWFNAPLGNGLLYMKEKWISNTYSLLSNTKKLSTKIEKFEVSGTKDYANIFGIAAAVSFLKSIGGIEAKEKRLTELTKYAHSKLQDLDEIEFLAPIENLCAILSFKFQNFNSRKIQNKLKLEYNIHIKSVKYKNKDYLRLSNNLFITKKDIDSLISSIVKIIKT